MRVSGGEGEAVKNLNPNTGKPPQKEKKLEMTAVNQRVQWSRVGGVRGADVGWCVEGVFMCKAGKKGVTGRR